MPVQPDGPARAEGARPLRLPVDEVLGEVLAAVGPHGPGSVVLQAPPGAGKTTRVPAALLDAGVGGKIVVLEPRRLAAQLSARRVAAERSERVGATVGYEVRFDRAISAGTRIEYVTEGIFMRRLLERPHLPGVGAVVLDEFHERHLQGDLALALLGRLQREARPDLKLVVMSATLDALPVAQFLQAPIVTSTGRMFDVAVRYAKDVDARPLESQVSSAVREVLEQGIAGDILVFLPGIAEIRNAIARCQPLAEPHNLALLPLHGDLAPAAQDLALARQARRKVIFSTNVAETSVTIEGVCAVIDSGLARVAKYDAWSGRPSLEVSKISRASAAQRAGRAGRLGPGLAIRLYTKGDHDTRPEHDVPEVLRADLAETALLLRSFAHGAEPLAWLDAPPRPAMLAADQLLARLGAIDASGAINDVGLRMLRLGIGPRLAKLVIDAGERGALQAGARVAAMLAEARDIYARSRDSASSPHAHDGPSDVTARLALIEEACFGGLDAGMARRLGVDAEVLRTVEKVAEQLMRAHAAAMVSPRSGLRKAVELTDEQRHQAVQRSLLAAFPDRVARRRSDGEQGRLGVRRDLLMCTGGTAVLAESSVVRTALWMVAVEAGDRAASPLPRAGAPGEKRQTRVWLASAIEPEWLIDVYPGAVAERIEVSWAAERQRVDAIARLTYDRLVIDEGPAGAAADGAAAALLADKVLAAGLAAFVDEGAYASFAARVELLHAEAPDLASRAGLQVPDEAWQREFLLARLPGKRSFDDLRATPLWEEFRQAVGHGPLTQLEALCPAQVTIGAGRRTKVHYQAAEKPWIASRLQDFFGTSQGPRIMAGRVPLVLHLLAPNGRDVQVTRDLAGFWARTYPDVRKELMRRYPRHAWPENPLTASPPAPRPPRSS